MDAARADGAVVLAAGDLTVSGDGLRTVPPGGEFTAAFSIAV